MPLVLWKPESSYTTSKQKHKAPKLPSNAQNKGTNVKLESANYLATQTKQCD